MDTPLFFAHSVSRKEWHCGAVYWLFQLLLLSALLNGFNALLPAPLPGSEINALYFLINFLSVAFIFRSYWKQLFLLLPETGFQTVLVAIPGFSLYWLLNLLTGQLITAIDPDFFKIPKFFNVGIKRFCSDFFCQFHHSWIARHLQSIC